VILPSRTTMSTLESVPPLPSNPRATRKTTGSCAERVPATRVKAASNRHNTVIESPRVRQLWSAHDRKEIPDDAVTLELAKKPYGPVVIGTRHPPVPHN